MIAINHDTAAMALAALDAGRQLAAADTRAKAWPVYVRLLEAQSALEMATKRQGTARPSLTPEEFHRAAKKLAPNRTVHTGIQVMDSGAEHWTIYVPGWERIEERDAARALAKFRRTVRDRETRSREDARRFLQRVAGNGGRMPNLDARNDGHVMDHIDRQFIAAGGI